MLPGNSASRQISDVDAIRQISELTETVPAKNRLNGNSLQHPNTSISTWNPQSSPQVEVVGTKQLPEQEYG